jgi:hypothetical protein
MPSEQQLSPSYPLPASKQLRWQTLAVTQFACLLHFFSICCGKSLQTMFFLVIMRMGSSVHGVQSSADAPLSTKTRVATAAKPQHTFIFAGGQGLFGLGPLF